MDSCRTELSGWRRRLFVCLTLWIALTASETFGQTLMLPPRINEKGLAILVSHLNASEAQLEAIRGLHAQYLSNWEASFAGDISKIRLLDENLYVNPHDFIGESMAKSYEALRDQADLIRHRTKSANDAFLDEIESILADSQSDGMLRMRMSLDRMTLKRGTYGIPERNIDIIGFLEAADLQPAERDIVDSYILTNGPSYVAALKDVAEADGRREVLNFQILDIVRAYPQGEMPQTAIADMSAVRAKAGKLNINTWKRLVKANRQWLEVVTSLLSEESAAALRRKYAELAYPEVYPDKAFADVRFADALNLPTLDADQSALMSALRDDYLAKHHSLSERLCRSLYDRQVLIFTGHATNQIDAAAEMEKARSIGEQREALNLAQPKAIRDVLTPEQAALIQPWTFEKSMPPRPWDPEYQVPKIECDEESATEKPATALG